MHVTVHEQSVAQKSGITQSTALARGEGDMCLTCAGKLLRDVFCSRISIIYNYG